MPHATGEVTMAICQQSPEQPPEAPRPPQTNQPSEHIRIKNRRFRYLDLHPEYFKTADIELADPLLYDRLVRQYQSTEEREKEGRARRFTGRMEADLVRSEAKLQALQYPDPNNPMAYKRAQDGSIIGVMADDDFEPKTKHEAWELWIDTMKLRFLRGDDKDFDYPTVDDNDEYDDQAEEDRNQLEEYLDQEDPQFLGVGQCSGQTGVQDF